MIFSNCWATEFCGGKMAICGTYTSIVWCLIIGHLADPLHHIPPSLPDFFSVPYRRKGMNSLEPLWGRWWWLWCWEGRGCITICLWHKGTENAPWLLSSPPLSCHISPSSSLPSKRAVRAVLNRHVPVKNGSGHRRHSFPPQLKPLSIIELPINFSKCYLLWEKMFSRDFMNADVPSKEN